MLWYGTLLVGGRVRSDLLLLGTRISGLSCYRLLHPCHYKDLGTRYHIDPRMTELCCCCCCCCCCAVALVINTRLFHIRDWDSSEILGSKSNSGVLFHKTFSGEAFIWLVSIAASAQAV